MGCSSSKIELSSIPTKRLSIQQSTRPPPNNGTSLLPTRFLESCLIVWIFDHTATPSHNEQEHLRRLVYALRLFNNLDACLHFIANTRDEKIFLIVSGEQRTIACFDHLPQIEKIYLFDSSFPPLTNNRQTSVRHDVVRDIDTLHQQLQHDIELFEMDCILMTVVSASSREITLSSSMPQNEAQFLYAQMIKQIMYRLRSDSCKDSLVEFCRPYYTDSSARLREVDDFGRDYRPNRALRCLTSSCFTAKIFNRVQRTREFDILYKLGFLLNQVKIQLNLLHDQNASLINHISVVYRGKTMSSVDFDTQLKNNIGGLVCVSHFLVANVEKQDAVDFVARRLATHPHLTGIVFEIHTAQTVFNEKLPFALMKDEDTNREEMCFYMNSVFRIESVMRSDDGTGLVWSVRLRTINDDDPQLHCLTSMFQNNEIIANSPSYSCKLFLAMNEYRRAEQIVADLLRDPMFCSQPRRLAETYASHGVICAHKHDYAKALEFYEQSLRVSLTYLAPDHMDLASIYRGIGDCHLNQSKYADAIENYEKAMELLRFKGEQDDSDVVNDLQTSLDTARKFRQNN